MGIDMLLLHSTEQVCYVSTTNGDQNARVKYKLVYVTARYIERSTNRILI